MSFDHRLWLSTGSTLSPMILVWRLSKSGLSFAMYPNSVVQTGVKSFGWENRTPHDDPSHSWKRIRPSVVSASKSGARSPICRAIVSLLVSLNADSSRYRRPHRFAHPDRRDETGCKGNRRHHPHRAGKAERIRYDSGEECAQRIAQ